MAVAKSTKTKVANVDYSAQMVLALKKVYAYIEFDPNGIILDANNLFTEVLGYTREEMLGNHHRMFVTPEYASSFEYKKFWSDLNAGITQIKEFTRITKTGRPIFIAASYNPVVNEKGEVVRVFKMAQDITERKTLADLGIQRKSMIDKSPVNAMFATPDGVMAYMNDASLKTLKALEQYLPDKAENLIGKSIDWFHKNPSHQRKIINDPKNLPFKSLISLGKEKLDLLISAIYDDEGNYVGAMVTWEIVTTKLELISDLTRSSDDLASSATNVLSISSSLSAAAEETSAQANTASVASEEVNAGVQTVARNMEEMVASIREITKTTNEASNMSNEAMKMAKNANQIINQLGESSMDIGNVIKVISSIAQQTNLLALNAPIEAARAGEAGKGFAVVANEVKELAKQTAKATNDITKKIETIQSDSKNAVEAIAEISSAIEKVNGYASNIAASVEEQAATTNEVTRIVTESAEGVKQINENISQVSQAAASTGRDASNSQSAAKVVGEIADTLKKYVARLKV
jgi:methyl-accepting chemotaxis protein